MTQLTTVFPERVSMGATGGAVWRTEIAETASGYEYTNRGWTQPKHRYVVGHDARKEAVIGPLRAHAMVANGSANSFPFKDWLDYKCPDYSGTGVFTALTASTFQFYKRYTSGSNYWDRKILLPKSGTITVTGGTVDSISYTTGIVTMTSGTPTVWSGEFFVLCRYADDKIVAELINGTTAKRIVGWSGIQLEEIRV
jgi:uncharacterized protein (TIGR02217 family)